ncbi:MAG: cyclic nucleotide-binding domain-containing protein [Myxococcales bacterium]
MLLGLLARLTRVHEARTAEEREAIYRFRYAIYGSELRRDYPGIDHEKGRLHQPEDDRPETRLWYAGSPREVTGTARARVWDRAPDEIVAELSLQRMPKVKVAYLERTMVRPTRRGRALMPAIIWHGYEMLARENVEACVLTCVPGLARHYLRFGARTYGAPLVEGASSAEVPLMILMNDVEHLRRVGSFMAPQLRKHARPFDAAPFQPLFDGPQPLCFDRTSILRELTEARPPVFEGVRLEGIARQSFILEIPAGGLVVRKGTADREMYLVLSGALEVEDSKARIGLGETMGEVALLGTPGIRTATVRATERSRLLVLRRRFLDDLDVRTAHRVTRNLARVVADRFRQRVG